MLLPARVHASVPTLEILELDVAQCGAWLCQLRNCRWKNFSLQGLRQMGDIWKRVQISWAWTTASKFCLSWLWIDWHSFTGTDLWYGPWLIDGWFDGWIDSLPDWLRDVITLLMKNCVGLDYDFAWTFFWIIYKASLQTGSLQSPNLWSQTCVHCWYCMYIWIASDWYSVSAQQVGGQVHRTHCLALKSWGCLLQQPIIRGMSLADLTVNAGGVVESSKYDLNPTWWIIVLYW